MRVTNRSQVSTCSAWLTRTRSLKILSPPSSIAFVSLDESALARQWSASGFGVSLASLDWLCGEAAVSIA